MSEFRACYCTNQSMQHYLVGEERKMRAKNEWGPKPPLAFSTRLFSFSRLSGNLEQAIFSLFFE